MSVQRRPEGLAEGEYRYGLPEYDGRPRIGTLSAKQHRLPSKSNQPSVWPIAILEGKAGIVLFTHGIEFVAPELDS